MQISIQSLGIAGALVIGLIGILYVSSIFYEKSPIISYIIIFVFAPIILGILVYYIYYSIKNRQMEISFGFMYISFFRIFLRYADLRFCIAVLITYQKLKFKRS